MRGVYSKVITAIETGRSHSSNSECCQDAIASFQKDNLSCATVCDGAGSADNSAIGARITADIACNLVVQNFDRYYLSSPHEVSAEVIDEVLHEFESVAHENEVPIKTLACTLSFVAVKATRKSVKYIGGNLGDGMVVQRRNNELTMLLDPENAEFANQTFFVTSKNSQDHLRIKKGIVPAAELPGWLITTDGAGPLLYTKSSNEFAPIVMSLLEDLRTLPSDRVEKTAYQLLSDVLIPAVFDDCSIGILQTVARGSNISRRAGC